MSNKITKEEFDKEVESYKETHLYQVKGDAYKNGFKDAIFLAWQIVDEHKEGGDLI